MYHAVMQDTDICIYNQRRGDIVSSMFHSAKGSLAGMPARHAGTLFPKIKSAIPSDDGREAAPPHVLLAYILMPQLNINQI